VARTYRRDSRGRFSGGGGGGGGRATGGSLAARSSARRSAAKLAGKDAADTSLSGTLSRRAQKAAATRTGKASKAAQTANRAQLAGRRPAGVIGKRGGAKPEASRTRSSAATAKGSGMGGSLQVMRARAATETGGRMKPPVTTSGLLREGGNRWQKNGMDRIYFNNLGERAGMKTVKYKSGNIYSAEIKGKGISNSKASEILGNLSDTKVFYDRQKRKMTVQEPRTIMGRPEQRSVAARMAKQAAAIIEKRSRAKVKNWKNRLG
jgi:hypothetical protein